MQAVGSVDHLNNLHTRKDKEKKEVKEGSGEKPVNKVGRPKSLYKEPKEPKEPKNIKIKDIDMEKIKKNENSLPPPFMSPAATIKNAIASTSKPVSCKKEYVNIYVFMM
jgi:hypothetical protein